MPNSITPSTVYIITGASRGLGEAFVRRLLRPDVHLLCVARSDNAALRREAETAGVRLDWFERDLAALQQLEPLMAELLACAGIGGGMLASASGVETISSTEPTASGAQTHSGSPATSIAETRPSPPNASGAEPRPSPHAATASSEGERPNSSGAAQFPPPERDAAASPPDVPRLRLINNAGVLEPIGPVHEAGTSALALNVAVNLTAPMALTAAFLRLTQPLAADKRVLNISSGAARKPYFGWSSYCAAKAGLDHFTRCVKLEQDALPYGAKLASVAPGVIDTAMQASIRAADEGRFRDLPRFRALHESGSLTPPNEAAERLLALLEHPDFGAEPVLDIRDITS
ncbi:SDR family NAD(P)-dependent oxidoreductase [Gordoniibacillus kamchatkensis]|uniref:SDR family NAD(P)-dependent oxidoreductase n=1 Tax=Gordoniibacillus kamchatkensis TaxID=1590651 RepID=UPI000695AC31|nr:SDR family NAD(P)-dependent oxidoreductase [Paenibacillus sp. VKM B-2647]